MSHIKVNTEGCVDSNDESYRPRMLSASVFILCFLSMIGYGVANSMLPYTMKSIKLEFNLSGAQAGSLVSIFIIGQILGGIIGGWATDAYGRSTVLKVCTLFSSILLSCLYFSQSYTQFSVLLFLGALFLGSVYIVSNVFLSEHVEDKYRSRSMSLLMVGFILGAIATALLAGWVIERSGWRSLYLVCAFPVLVALFMHGYDSKHSQHNDGELESKAQVNAPKKSNQFGAIFRSGTHLKFFILWTVCSGALQFGYMGLISWLPTYYESGLALEFQSMTMYMVLTYSCSIATKFIAGTMADKWGCRLVFGVGTVGTAIFLFALVNLNTPDNSIYLIALFSLMFGIPFGILSTYMVESFPTSIRGTAVGASFNIGGAFTAFAPPLIGYYADLGQLGTGMQWMAVAYVVSGTTAFLFIRNRMHNPLNSD